MSIRERLSGIWLMAMTLLALFAYTLFFVAQMWLKHPVCGVSDAGDCAGRDADPLPVGAGKAEIQAR